MTENQYSFQSDIAKTLTIYQTAATEKGTDGYKTGLQIRITIISNPAFSKPLDCNGFKKTYCSKSKGLFRTIPAFKLDYAKHAHSKPFPSPFLETNSSIVTTRKDIPNASNKTANICNLFLKKNKTQNSLLL